MTNETYYVYRERTLLFNVFSLKQAIDYIGAFYGYDEVKTRPNELKAYQYNGDRIYILDYLQI